ncbi:hypothetical protein [Paracoccus lutimaris]|uniref:Uncharacterized protein n=1 Tax=Paracoccus lutimaris TaxID=1490030 RepID=A0A368YTC4_9RHOB|nr:hypothetical protein [Paracoccus lutimaris]RCW83461.1 hypothetical protein DFP89_110143 [Paracoccus lutimaris]
MKSSVKTTPVAASVTGRDGYIVVKALIYAIARIQSLPEDRQEYSDMLDMCTVLHDLDFPQSMLDMIHSDVEHHMQREVDLYPGEGMEAERKATRARIDAERARIDAMKSDHAEALRCFNESDEAV